METSPRCGDVNTDIQNEFDELTYLVSCDNAIADRLAQLKLNDVWDKIRLAPKPQPWWSSFLKSIHDQVNMLRCPSCTRHCGYIHTNVCMEGRKCA